MMGDSSIPERTMIGRIKTVGIYVEDQRKSLDFYTKQLGFEVRRDEPMGPGGNWVEVGPPGAETCLVLFPRAMMDGWERMKPSVVFRCEDVERTCSDLAARGVAIIEQPRRMAWGTYAKFTDLDGNEFILASP
jgi:lactoylglutathione lyase